MREVDDALMRKRSALDEILGGFERAVVAYSGGVDSSVLAAVAHERLGKDTLAVTAVSASLAQRERRAAADLAHRFGWNHLEIETGEVARTEYARNAPDRCYWCKTELFEVLGPLARARSATVLGGTNSDDLHDHRPGRRAAREQGVRAPLAEAGLSKGEVRALAGELGLPVAAKPASPCLASRVAYGVQVTEEILRRIDAAEEVVRSLGFDVVRVRDHGDLARIEVPAERIAELAAVRAQIEAELRELGFAYVTVDLTGFRSGAMNEVLGPPRISRTRSS
jgi:uncharacterized protein